VKLICKLDPLHAIPIVEMKDKLSIFHNLTSPYAWTGRLRGSPQKWNQKDGEAILAAVKDAELHPIERRFDPVKLKKMPPILKTAKGVSVIIPDDSDNEADEGDLLSKLITDPPAVTDEAKEQPTMKSNGRY
jgi:hypothetical protein